MADQKNLVPIENQGDIVIYQTEDGDTKIDVRFVDETVWLTQQQMAELFQSSVATSWSTFSISTRKANWMKSQPVGNSDRFVPRATDRSQERFRINTKDLSGKTIQIVNIIKWGFGKCGDIGGYRSFFRSLYGTSPDYRGDSDGLRAVQGK